MRIITRRLLNGNRSPSGIRVYFSLDCALFSDVRLYLINLSERGGGFEFALNIVPVLHTDTNETVYKVS